MDELELSGRRHISTKRAGKEHGYHSDYIGQLIRGKKVAGQKVGRSWYVDEESLRVYLGKAEGTPAPVSLDADVVEEAIKAVPAIEEEKSVIEKKPESIEEIEEEKVEIKEARPVVQENPVNSEIPVRTAEQKTETSQAYAPAVHPILERPVTIHTQGGAASPATLSGLTYIDDEEPLLPLVRPHKVEAEEENEATIKADSEPRRKVLPALRKVALLAILVAVMVGMSAAAGTFIASTVQVEEGQSSAVFYTFWNQ